MVLANYLNFIVFSHMTNQKSHSFVAYRIYHIAFIVHLIVFLVPKCFSISVSVLQLCELCS